MFQRRGLIELALNKSAEERIEQLIDLALTNGADDFDDIVDEDTGVLLKVRWCHFDTTFYQVHFTKFSFRSSHARHLYLPNCRLRLRHIPNCGQKFERAS
jgi:transcriptional/translational regulatory protein YebC/TACO1